MKDSAILESINKLEQAKLDASSNLGKKNIERVIKFLKDKKGGSMAPALRKKSKR